MVEAPLSDRLEYAILRIVYRNPSDARHQNSWGGWGSEVKTDVLEFTGADLLSAFKRLWKKGVIRLTKPDSQRYHAQDYSGSESDDHSFFFMGDFNVSITDEGRSHWDRLAVSKTATPATNFGKETPRETASGFKGFICYAHKDEEFKDELLAHCSVLHRQGLLRSWHDRKLIPGERWNEKIRQELDAAEVILPLVSVNFLSSEYCWDVELKRALERHRDATALMIPIILKPSDWSHSQLGAIQVLPKDGRPVTSWSNRDEAWLDVIGGIRRAINSWSNVSGNFNSTKVHPTRPANAISEPQAIESSSKLYDAEVEAAQQSDRRLPEIRKTGYWRVVIRPRRPYKLDILTLSQCREQIQKSQVRLHGWMFPWGNTTEARSRQHWIEDGGSNEPWHANSWHYFQSCQFMNWMTMQEDYMHETGPRAQLRTVEMGLYLELMWMIAVTTLVYKFAGRLALNNPAISEWTIQIDLHGTEGRRIAAWGNASIILGNYTCDVPSVSFRAEHNATGLANASELALDAAVYFLERFNWNDPDRGVLRNHQAKLLGNG